LLGKSSPEVPWSVPRPASRPDELKDTQRIGVRPRPDHRALESFGRNLEDSGLTGRGALRKWMDQTVAAPTTPAKMPRSQAQPARLRGLSATELWQTLNTSSDADAGSQRRRRPVRRSRRPEARPLADLSDFQPAELSDFGPALTRRSLKRCAHLSNLFEPRTRSHIELSHPASSCSTTCVTRIEEPPAPEFSVAMTLTLSPDWLAALDDFRNWLIQEAA